MDGFLSATWGSKSLIQPIPEKKGGFFKHLCAILDGGSEWFPKRQTQHEKRSTRGKTNMTMENSPFEDVVLLKIGISPTSHVSYQGV